jgi:YfiH family protein
MTTRRGGTSSPPYDTFNLAEHVGDDLASVAQNRALLSDFLPALPRWLRQVHGVRVADGDDDELWGNSPIDADACTARRRATVCTVLVADCLPVLLCDARGEVVAAAHAGWRGLSGGVLEATIAAMKCEAHTLLAWLGPAIGPSAFEVGEDVLCAFSVADDREAANCFISSPPDHAGAGRWRGDLFTLARLRLQRSGVAQIYGGGDCTYSQPRRYFSHRRDRRCGRQAAFIWME